MSRGRRWGIAAASALALALPAADASAEVVASSGSLRADVTPDPWHLTFSDSAGRQVLSEASGTGTGPVGTIGFETGAGWQRATRVLSAQRQGDSWVATLETTDAGRQLQMSISPDGEGSIAVSATIAGSIGGVLRTGVSFAGRPGERYLGFGERSNAVDQAGNEVEHYVSDGPYAAADRPGVAGIIPPQGWRPRDDATYFPMPWLLSTAGYGVLIDDNEPSRHRLGDDVQGIWSMQVDAPHLDFRVLAGPTPLDALRRLTERIGRQPKPAAPWVYGSWFHAGQENQPPAEREQAATRTQRDADVPISAIETHLRYLPCGSSVGKHAHERERTAFFHANGLATLTYFNPEICTDYEPVYSQAVAAGVLQRDPSNQPYAFNAFVGDHVPASTPISQIDFTAPGAQSFFDAQLSEAVADGHDGWMEDFGEYTPLDAVSANGMPGEQMHNYYPVPYHRAGYDFATRQSRPISRHIRSGWTGVAPYAQTVWGGDPSTDWGYDGLRSAVYEALTMGLSGISNWGSDIGGYFTVTAPKLTDELLTRWVQFGSVSGLMRTKFGGFTIAPGQRVQVYDPSQISNWRRYAKLRTQLYPYITAADARYRRTGMPLMRHLSLVYPGDTKATATDDEFMFGPDLLAAPVLAPGERTRTLYLPPGRWVEFWKGVRYVERSGDLKLRRARAIAGAREVTVGAALDELPLMIRAGSILPLLPASTDTLADRYDTRSLTSLRDQRHRMEVLAFPRGRSASSFFGAGERLVSREKRGAWKLRIRGSTQRAWKIEASLATLRHPFVPRCVAADGEVLPKGRWSYSAKKRRILVRVKARRATIRVRSRCG